MEQASNVHALAEGMNRCSTRRSLVLGIFWVYVVSERSEE